MKISMHFQTAAMYILKGTIKCNVINHGIAHLSKIDSETAEI